MEDEVQLGNYLEDSLTKNHIFTSPSLMKFLEDGLFSTVGGICVKMYLLLSLWLVRLGIILWYCEILFY